VISGATNFGLLGTAITSLAACAVYLSFLISSEKTNSSRRTRFPNCAAGALLARRGLLTYQLARATNGKHRAQQAVEENWRVPNRSLQRRSRGAPGERLAALGH